MRNNDYKITIEQRLTRVETVLNEIAENHIPHLQKDIDSIKQSLAKYTGALVLGEVILGIVLWYFR